MLTSLVALTLTLAPSDLDLSPRRSFELAPAAKVEVAPAQPRWATPPMVSAEGRNAKLLTDAQLDRAHAIDAELASFTVLPSRVVGVLGGIAACTPFIFATGYAFMVVGELASSSAVTLLLAGYVFPWAYLAGLLALPVWGWVVAGVGLAVAVGAAAATSHLEHHRADLLAERRALLDSTKAAPIDATSLVPVGTF